MTTSADRLLQELRKHKPKSVSKPRVGAVIIFKEDVDHERAQELLNMMAVRLIEPAQANVYDANVGGPVWYIP